MMKKILVVLGLALVVICALAAMQPSDFRISRSATMAAPAADVFAQVNDFHNWNNWSPWAKMDPQAINSFEGPSAGVGAAFSWSGNNQVGAGKMTITESRVPELIRIKLEFTRPMTATNEAEFTFKNEGNQTNVTWTMSGKNNFLGKLISLFMNCDKMVGGNFEQGLASIKSIVEKPTSTQ